MAKGFQKRNATQETRPRSDGHHYRSFQPRSRSPQEYRGYDHDNDYNNNNDNYRPEYERPRRRRSPSPRRFSPPSRNNYRPSRRSPPRDTYQFRGHAERRRDERPLADRVETRDNFSFRAPANAPTLHFNRPRVDDCESSTHAQPYQNSRGGARGGRGGRGGFSYGASGRVILHQQRSTTPERLEGMLGTGVSFKALEDLSESEADMDLASDGETDGQPNAKKARVDVESDTVPKWSNPDPYTSLPPTEESQGKKKDVLKLIRKAKVMSETFSRPVESLAADNANFISFDSDSDKATGGELGNHKVSTVPHPKEYHAPPVNGFTAINILPSGERFNHFDNLHLNQVLPELPQDHDLSSAPVKHQLPQRPQVIVPPNVTSHSTSRTSSFKLPPRPNDSRVPTEKRSNLLDDEADAVTLRAPPASAQGHPRPQKRKRDLADFMDPRAPPGKPTPLKFRIKEINGSLLREWRVPEGLGTPWCTKNHPTDSETPSSSLLHREILAFYDFIKPRDFENAMRQDLVDRLSATLRSRHPNGTLHCFGSYGAGLYLPSSDMDLVFVSDKFQATGRPQFGLNRTWMQQLLSYLQQSGHAHYEDFEVIEKAKVPLIKFVDKKTNLHVDISFENMSGVVANITFQQWKAQFPAMPILVTLVKQFLLMRGLNEVFCGGIGGFTVTCLVTSMLQHHPGVQSGNMRPEEHLGEMFMSFLDLYGKKFNMNLTGIQMNPPLLYIKNFRKPMRLEVMDPNQPGNDISGGSRKVGIIFNEFWRTFKQLQRRLCDLEKMSDDERRGQSILGVAFAGDYQSFGYQRNHLRAMFELRNGDR